MLNHSRIPPSPEVLAHLFADYRRYRDAAKKPVSFKRYLERIGFTDPAARFKHGDSGTRVGPKGAKLVQVPSRQVKGSVKVVVLLVDFPDKPGHRPATEFEEMLFSKATFQTGSLRDFYTEVSLGQVDVTGTVHGWLRMPQKYSYYVNNKSGTGGYPKNVQKLAEDAIAVALKKKSAFDPGLDNFNDGSITALVLVHAGRGAEVLGSKLLQNAAIWSHKADMKKAVEVLPGLAATNYLTVPEDCHMGVCAHELGHLLFQWDDFYDPNYADDGTEWDGSGVWDLMAAGSWNDGGITPAHPAGLHKSQHGWVTIQDIAATKAGVVIPPYTANSGTVVRIRSPRFTPTQCLILENRRRTGFDRMLPGEGLLVWLVDPRMEMTAPGRPAMLLVEADGRHDLETPNDSDEGDVGDPFPGPQGKNTSVGDTGPTSTSFAGVKSGVSITSIKANANGSISFDVAIA